MELIDKNAVIAEIKGLIRTNELYLSEPNTDEIRFQKVGAYSVLNDLLHFIDTLEVKEVDLDSDIRTYLTNHFNIYEDGVLESKKSGLPLRTYDIIKVAEHFFELGLAAQSSSVWHCVSTETPTKFGNPIIVASKNKNKEDGIWLYDLIQSWEGKWSPRVNWETPVKWAYMDDLLNLRNDSNYENIH